MSTPINVGILRATTVSPRRLGRSTRSPAALDAPTAAAAAAAAVLAPVRATAAAVAAAVHAGALAITR